MTEIDALSRMKTPVLKFPEKVRTRIILMPYTFNEKENHSHLPLPASCIVCNDHFTLS